MIAPPRPLQSGSERVIGKSPRTVQSLVRTMGSKRLAPASATDSKNGIPCFLFKLILSIINMELVTIIPKRASTPIRAGKESGVPVSAKTKKTLEPAHETHDSPK
jgi:hypothetical protein